MNHKWKMLFPIFLLISSFPLCFCSCQGRLPNLITDRTVVNRISGGVPAAAEQFPFYVYMIGNGPGFAWSCGGSILNAMWVLTAAHCTQNLTTIDLYFGAINLYDFEIILSSSTWLEHSGYNPANCNNDIAIVKLPSELNYTNSIQPTTLLLLKEHPDKYVNRVAIVMGFGRRGDDPVENDSEFLLYTHVKIVTNEHCASYFGNDVVKAGTVCAVGFNATNQSVCGNDSGGPMMIPRDEGGYSQVGINSFISDKGCTKGFPSGYTRVHPYVNWIGSMISSN